MIDPTMFCVRDGILSRNAILEVMLKEDRHCKKVTHVSTVAFLTTGFADDAQLVGVHAMRRIRFARVSRVWHPVAESSIQPTSLHDCRDKIPLHVAVKWFRIAQSILVQVIGGGGGVITIHEGVNPRTTAKIPIERFDSAAFSNLLSKFADTEVVWEVSNREPTVVIKGALHALDGNDKRFHYLHQVAGRDPLQK